MKPSIRLSVCIQTETRTDERIFIIFDTVYMSKDLQKSSNSSKWLALSTKIYVRICVTKLNRLNICRSKKKNFEPDFTEEILFMFYVGTYLLCVCRFPR
jgi:sulfur relay (sulfurtransferase) complex TusBCD TusD component (DsrE family)